MATELLVISLFLLVVGLYQIAVYNAWVAYIPVLLFTVKFGAIFIGLILMYHLFERINSKYGSAKT